MAETSPSGSIDLSESKRPMIYGSTIFCYCLAVIGVGLRLLSRKLVNAELGADDWFIGVALAFATGVFALNTVWTVNSLGVHIATFGPDVPAVVEYFFLHLFVGEIIYTCTLCLAKYSILSFYRRLFGRSSMQRWIYILAVLVTCWGFAVILTTVFQCSPVRGFWDKSTNPTCAVQDYSFFIGISVPNILTDVALLLLPIPHILRLNTTMVQKVALCVMFLIGGLVCVISIFRLTSLIFSNDASPDITWNFVEAVVWTEIETYIAVFCACLPSLRPIITLITTGSVQSSNHTNSLKYNPSMGPRSWVQRRQSFTSLQSSHGILPTSLEPDRVHVSSPWSANSNSNGQGNLFKKDSGHQGVEMYDLNAGSDGIKVRTDIRLERST